MHTQVFHPSRRRFLWLAGGILPLLQLRADDGARRFHREGLALGSQTSITVLHDQLEVAREATAAAFAELERIEDIMSLYRPQSQLSQLNATGELRDPHPYLLEVLAYAGKVSAATKGAFDITVQPLWAEFAAAKKLGRLPHAAQLAKARERVNWRQVEFDAERVRLTQPGGAITLNGIAQGFAADKVAGVLKAYGIEHALIDAGELSSIGTGPENAPWKVGIQHPRIADAFVSLANLPGRALATSGDYETAFSADLRHHHIFDPRTGDSPLSFSSVSVAAPTAMEADALSTALFVLEPDQGLAVLRESFPKADALLVSRDGEVHSTPGFPRA